MACPQVQHCDDLVEEIRGLLAAQGLGYGRQTYGCYSDGDRLLCRAAWCVVVHTRPSVVIETGVAHGVTSRVILEALQLNGHGHLWSIDLPNPFDQGLHVQIGVAVTEACRDRWSYIQGASRRRLRPLVAEVGRIDLFLHDSLHTLCNAVFEMESAAAAISPGGIMLVDDIMTHRGFAMFCKRHPGYRTIVCPSEDRKAMFGIAASPGSC